MGLAFGGETGPDLTGRDGSPVVRNPYAHRSISLIQSTRRAGLVR